MIPPPAAVPKDASGVHHVGGLFVHPAQGAILKPRRRSRRARRCSRSSWTRTGPGAAARQLRGPARSQAGGGSQPRLDFRALAGDIAACAELGVDLIEQPLPRGRNEGLEGFRSPVTLAADEPCLPLGELDVATRCYEALRLARTARERGCRLMVEVTP
jgi:hypothetical protein